MKRGRKAKIVGEILPPMAGIAVDSRDAGKDIFIPRSKAKRLYEEGKLAQDLTNHQYAPHLGYSLDRALSEVVGPVRRAREKH